MRFGESVVYGVMVIRADTQSSSMLTVADLIAPENRPIAIELGSGWVLQIEPDSIEVELPAGEHQDIDFHLAGTLPTAPISILQVASREEVCTLDQLGDAVCDSEILCASARDSQSISEALGAYIDGYPWPLACTDLNYNWGRIIEIDLQWHRRLGSHVIFIRHAPDIQDIAEQLPINFQMTFVNQLNEVQRYHEFNIETLPHPRHSEFEFLLQNGLNWNRVEVQLSREDEVACSIQITLADETLYRLMWFINPLMDPIRRLIDVPEIIPMELWYGRRLDDLSVDCEELEVHRGNGLQWNRVEVQLSRVDAVREWSAAGYQREPLKIDFLDHHDGENYPYIELDSDGYHIHALVEHNLRGDSLNYFHEHALFRCGSHLCHSEQSRISDTIQKVIIDPERSDWPNNRHIIQIAVNPRNREQHRTQIQGLDFPEMILPIDELPENLEHDEMKYVCRFHVEPYHSSLQIIVTKRIYDDEDHYEYNKTCNYDGVRSDGTGGCGRRLHECICEHPDGPIDSRAWTKSHRRVPSEFYRTREHEESWYFGIVQQWLDDTDDSDYPWIEVVICIPNITTKILPFER